MASTASAMWTSSPRARSCFAIWTSAKYPVNCCLFHRRQTAAAGGDSDGCFGQPVEIVEVRIIIDKQTDRRSHVGQAALQVVSFTGHLA